MLNNFYVYFFYFHSFEVNGTRFHHSVTYVKLDGGDYLQNRRPIAWIQGEYYLHKISHKARVPGMLIGTWEQPCTQGWLQPSSVTTT
jgi:hypothetical protein